MLYRKPLLTTTFGVLVLAILGVSTAPAQGTLGSSNPRDLIAVPGGAWLVSTVAPSVAALIHSNGTPGAAKVVTTFPTTRQIPSPTHLTTVASGLVFFGADAGIGSGTELWVSDETGVGTHAVADLRAGSRSSWPRDLLAFGTNAVLFSAELDGLGREPCWSDGDTVRPLGDLRPGPLGSAPRELTRIGSLAVFSANDGVHGDELWITNGTAAGTRLLRDLRPGPVGSSPHGFLAAGGEVWFSAHDGVSGFELWKTDGTATGTQRVVDLRPGAASSQPSDLTSALGLVFFTAYSGASAASELWQSDGTAAGTARVGPTGPGAPLSPSRLTGAAGRLWFVADDGVHGAELWSTTGATGATRLVRDIHGGSESSAPDHLVELNAQSILLTADDGVSGREIWNATSTNATLVRDIAPGSLSGKVTGLTRVGNQVLFAAQQDDATGQELFRTDGTSSGTYLIDDLDTAPGQLTLEVAHEVAILGPELQLSVPAIRPVAFLLGTRGPGIDLNTLGVPSYGLLGLEPSSLAIVTIVPQPGATGPVELSLALPPVTGLAVQAATHAPFAPVMLSGVTTLSRGSWDLSTCATCSGVPSLSARVVKYADDTFEYEVDLFVAPSPTDLWLRIVRMHADQTSEEVRFLPIRPGRTLFRDQLEILLDETIELRVHCGDPSGPCYARRVLGC